jgi:dihydrofolate synthase/folylpolyglutamate synthase
MMAARFPKHGLETRILPLMMMSSPPHGIAPLQTYDETLCFLDGLDVSAMKLGLERVKKLLETLGNPQDSLPTVHIAGTNGKGSVTAMLASILKFAGYSVGTFTSPHLIHVRERIAINGNPILPDDFVFEANALKAHLEALDWPREDWPTYFEFLNVMAYQYFKRKGLDVIVVETGLGGRLDSTNVVKHPSLTVITSIGMDHMAHLGDTLGKIAAEKAGIIKHGAPLVLGCNLPEEAQTVILSRVAEVNTPVMEASADGLRVEPSSQAGKGLMIYNEATRQTYCLALLGPYQKNNLATVLACVHQLRLQGYEVNETAVQDGLAHTYWPVRFQYFERHRLVLDGSHNPDGFASLEESLLLYFSETPKVWLISLRNNRETSALVALMQRVGCPLGVIVTQAKPERLYHAPETLADEVQAAFGPDIPIIIAPTPTDALAELPQLQGQFTADNPLGLITGSLYTAGEILHALERG